MPVELAFRHMEEAGAKKDRMSLKDIIIALSVNSSEIEIINAIKQAS